MEFSFLDVCFIYLGGGQLGRQESVGSRSLLGRLALLAVFDWVAGPAFCCLNRGMAPQVSKAKAFFKGKGKSKD
jgi:hypothetical protein